MQPRPRTGKEVGELPLSRVSKEGTSAAFEHAEEPSVIVKSVKVAGNEGQCVRKKFKNKYKRMDLSSTLETGNDKVLPNIFITSRGS